MLLKGNEVMERIEMRAFQSPKMIESGWKQTIAAHFWPQRPDLEPSKYHQVEIDAGDSLSLVEYSGEILTPEAPIAVFVHGLNGDYKSKFIQRIIHPFAFSDFRIFGLNLRNCGPGLGLSRRIYNAGTSEDLEYVYHWIRKRYPESSILFCGYSLGGNIVLKAMAEYEFEKTKAVAVCPPIDLLACSRKLSQKENRFFDQLFYVQTLRQFRRVSPFLEKQLKIQPKWKENLYDLDERYTAPLSGFSSAKEYYAKSSSLPKLPQIQSPTFILSAIDDPVVDSDSLLTLKAPTNLDIVITKAGGHVAYIHEEKHQRRWMDDVILKWTQKTPC